MTRIFCMIGIFLFLIGIGITEELFASNIIKELNTQTVALASLIESNEDNLKISEIDTKYKILKNFWKDKEHGLTHFVNFEKIKPINESIIKLEGALAHDDFSVALENIKLLVTYGNNLKYMIGMNFTNVF